jgi:hypothetical protein
VGGIGNYRFSVRDVVFTSDPSRVYTHDDAIKKAVSC